MLVNPAALRALRQRSGLTQTDLAKAAHIDQSHLSALERGRGENKPTSVRPKTARNLASGLKVPLSAILIAPNEAEPAADEPEEVAAS